MINVKKAKEIAKQVLPPIITTAIKRASGMPRHSGPRPVPELQYPLEKGTSIIEQARRHLEQASPMPEVDGLGPSKRWTLFRERILSRINGLETTAELIAVAQKVAFDHRTRPEPQHIANFEAQLKSEYPHFSNAIDAMGDSPYSSLVCRSN